VDKLETNGYKAFMPDLNSQRPTFLENVTRLVQTVQAKVKFPKLKPGAKVPELKVQASNTMPPTVYPLLGDRYTVGRSSRASDIVIRHAVVSQTHFSLKRNGRGRHAPFVLRDEQSTNGVYWGKRPIKTITLRHGDQLTLGPPELADGVKVWYVDPPSLPIRILHYALYTVGGVTGLMLLAVLVEWPKFSVYPLPTGIQGPVVVYARDGLTPLRAPRTQAHLELKSLSEFSPYLPKAVLASEDTRFNWHIGVDPIGVLRAILTNVLGGEIREGASTITQQVARSLFRDYVGTADSLGRKYREAIVALKLEAYYSKDFLLKTYLNRVYLGSGLYGFEDAAQFYFGKSARALTLSEAATLVGILPAPNRFNPVRDYQSAIAYRNRVLERMVTQGMVSPDEAQTARRSRIEVHPNAQEELQSTIAPYVYDHVFSELESLLGTQVAQEGNFLVETELDPIMQRQLESNLRNTVATVGANARFSQGAIVTLDARSGAVLALAGGTDYQTSQFNRATQALRQPGSTFKIFTYTAALERDRSPSDTYSCAPVDWDGQFFPGCGEGGLDLYTAVANSVNAIALRVAQEVGLDNLIRTAQKMGIQSKLTAVPGLVLGQSEVTLLEMTGGFAVLANGGLRNRPHIITRILDSSDCQDYKRPKTCRVIYDYFKSADANVPVLHADIATTMTDLLRGVVSQGTGRSAAIGLDVAGKTGTTNDNVDLWFVGYIPVRGLVTGVWLGNDDNTPTAGSSAQAAQLWGDYMHQVIQ
jgi:penicillin-binding protein 1A